MPEKNMQKDMKSTPMKADLQGDAKSTKTANQFVKGNDNTMKTGKSTDTGMDGKNISSKDSKSNSSSQSPSGKMSGNSAHGSVGSSKHSDTSASTANKDAKIKDDIRSSNYDESKDDFKTDSKNESKHVPYNSKTDTRNSQNTVSSR